MSKKKHKTFLGEKLPDPKLAFTELSDGGPRSRTAAHLKRILTASLSLPMAAGITIGAASYQVVDPIPPPAVLAQPIARIQVKTPMRVEIDGRSTAMASNSATTLGGGTHRIQVTSDSNSTTFAIDIALNLNASRNPGADPVPRGVLKLLSTANVRIDGNAPRRITPQDSVELGPGPHTIEFAPIPAASTQTFTLDIGTVQPAARGR